MCLVQIQVSSISLKKCYNRGSKGSYQKWADTVRDDSYTFENILPYFKKSVQFTNPSDVSISYDPTAFSSSGGPLDVSYTNYALPISPGVQQGLQTLGLKSIRGLNSGTLMGFAHSTNTINPAAEIRSSSETSFLQGALLNTSLQVYQQTMAKRILFDVNKRASAVSVTTAGVPYFLEAKKEVIVAAGVVGLADTLPLRGCTYSHQTVQFTSNAHGIRDWSAADVGAARNSSAF